MNSDSRRLAAIRVSGEYLRDGFFRNTPAGESFRITNGIPDDAKFVRMWIDEQRNQLVCVYEHESFKLTTPGEMVWDAEMPMVTTMHPPIDYAAMRCGVIDRDEIRSLRGMKSVLTYPNPPLTYTPYHEMTDEQKQELGEAFEAGTLRVTMRCPAVVMDAGESWFIDLAARDSILANRAAPSATGDAGGYLMPDAVTPTMMKADADATRDPASYTPEELRRMTRPGHRPPDISDESIATGAASIAAGNYVTGDDARAAVRTGKGNEGGDADSGLEDGPIIVGQ